MVVVEVIVSAATDVTDVTMIAMVVTVAMVVALIIGDDTYCTL